MTKFLGLDLGTNSIGWAVIETDTDILNLNAKGVHIFSEGVKIEKGVESSKASERTRYRSARRIKFRRKLRKIETLKVLIENGMCPLAMEDLKAWKNNKKDYPKSKEFLKWLATDEETGINPYFFRAKASREKMGKMELGRAFYHLSQRRGFLSNRLDKGSDEAIDDVRNELIDQLELESNKEELIATLNLLIENYNNEDVEDKVVKNFVNKFSKLLTKLAAKEFDDLKSELLSFLNKKENLGAVKKGITELNELIKESGCETLGQYFYEVYKRKGKIRKHYTAREEHYLVEFNKICAAQGLTPTLCKQLYDAIFYQRKLKSQKGLVGKCIFEKAKPRCPVSHPSYEEFRALQFINSIKIGDTEKGKKEFLTPEQRKQIWGKFIRKSKPTFEFAEIAKELTPSGTERFFNYKSNVTVSGCPTMAQFANVFGSDWQKAMVEAYTNKKTKKGEKTTGEIVNDVWHAVFSFDNEEKLKLFGKNKLGLNEQGGKKFSKIILKKEYANLSLKAIEKILIYLRQGLLYSHAVFLANLDAVIGKELWSKKEVREEISAEIARLIEGYTETKRREGIVNDLVGSFKNEYNNADKNYVLDALDKKDVFNKIIDTYGKSYFEQKNEEEQQEIIKWVEEQFEKQLRKYRGAFIKPKRLDEQIADFLKGNFNADDTSLLKIYHPSDIEKFKTPERNKEDQKLYLMSPVIPAIKNPMAMRTMHRLRKLINALIREDVIDETTKIHIELARELNDANKRKAIQEYQKQRATDREKYYASIKQLYKAESGKDIEPTEDDLLKYQLWEEQDHVCLYTGKNIKISDFIGGNPMFDIEHTIPRSISSDNSQENKTLCDVEFNRTVKGNKIPTELAVHANILPRLIKWNERIKELDYKVQSRKKARGMETKEQKDKRIKQKHLFKLEYDYWHGKYSRFVIKDVTKGFKNSQLVDTGIITKYAKEYLKTIFDNVYSIKGEMTAEFRRLWGLQDEYKKKERINHAHHCIDAITVACITKDKYDMLASAHRADEENKKQVAKDILRQSKPWATFAEDMKTLEQELLVTHYTPDQMGKASKKRMRIRGKLKRDKNGQVMYQQGDTARVALHKDTFYGAIERHDVDKKTGEILKDENGDDKKVIKYVVRKELGKLKESDIEKVVDATVKEKLAAAVENNGFKKAMANVVWMNEEKGIEIKKVRIFADSVTDPIKIKYQNNLSRKDYKLHYYAQNDGNYIIALYETINEKGKKIQDFEIINNMTAVDSINTSTEDKGKPTMVPENKTIISGKKDYVAPLKFFIKKGMHVLFYKENAEEILEMSKKELSLRLYKVVKFDKSGRVYFRPHTEARPASELKEQYIMKYDSLVEQIPVTIKNLNALIENKDFTISILGNIEFKKGS
jgi:CRISPR-associated endonuclease Csn1